MCIKRVWYSKWHFCHLGRSHSQFWELQSDCRKSKTMLAWRKQEVESLSSTLLPTLTSRVIPSFEKELGYEATCNPINFMAFVKIPQRLSQRYQHNQFEPRTKISIWPMTAIPEDWLLWKKQLVLQNDFMSVYLRHHRETYLLEEVIIHFQPHTWQGHL